MKKGAKSAFIKESKKEYGFTDLGGYYDEKI